MSTELNPLLRVVQNAISDGEARRNIAKAIAESAPLDRISHGSLTPHGDAVRMRNVPITAIGVAAVQPGTQPLQALLSKERRRQRLQLTPRDD